MNMLKPYPGLRPFERHESRIFFGREEQVDELLLRLKSHHFLAVLGASGSGKSSLVKAGLLPGLAKGYMGEVGSRWSIAEMRPGDQPFVRLAEGLLQDKTFQQAWNGDQAAFLAAELRRGARSLHEVLEHAPLPDGAKLLILVDQFEELFRFREQQENQAAAFVALLLEASLHPDIYIAITMRSDFLGAAAEFHGLPEAINDGLYLTPRLTRSQLHDAICLPAQLFGGSVDDTLANALQNEAGNDPDQLPLLQHALMRLWDNDADKHLTLEEYRDLNGLKGALNDHAEQAWLELNTVQQAVAETLFRALTERSSREGQAIRRPVKVQQVLEIAQTDLTTLQLVVEVFRQPGRNFLMPPQVALQPDIMLDISHESLIRQWQRLQDWVREEGKKAAMYLRLLDAAQRHRNHEADLWQGTDLALALQWRNEQKPNKEWAKRYGGEFALVEEFLNDSDAEEQQRQAEKEAQRQVAMARLQKQLFVAAAGFVIAAVLSFWAVTESIRADEQAKIAQLNEQKAKSAEQQATRGLFDSTLTHASLLTQIEDFAEARTKLNSIRRYDPEVAAPRVHARQLLAGYVDIMGGEAQATLTDVDGKPLPPLLGGVAISPDGHWLAAAGERGTIALFERATGKLVQKLKGHDNTSLELISDVNSIVFHPTQPWLFSTGEDKQIIVWSLPIADQEAQIKQQWIVDSSGWSLAIDPKGQVLASGHVDGSICLWQLDVAQPSMVAIGEVDDPQPWRRLEGHKEAIAQSSGLAFSADGQWLVSASYDDTVRVWSWQDENSVAKTLRGHQNDVDSVVFSADGHWLASVSADHNIMLWDTQDWQSVRTFKGHLNRVFGLQFVTDDVLASASRDQTIRLWNVHTGVTQRILQGHTAAIGGLKSWQDQGQSWLYSTGNDGTVKRWSAELEQQWLIDLPTAASSSALSPDGKYVVIGLENGTIESYDLTKQLKTSEIAAHANQVLRLVFSNNGSLLASGSHDNTAMLWKFGTDGQLSLERVIDDHFDSVHAVAFSSDDKQLATASYDGHIGFFSLTDEQQPLLIKAHQGKVTSVSFDQNGTQLLSSGAEDFALKLWDLKQQPPIAKTLATANNVLLWSSFSPDDINIAGVGRGGNITIYSLNDPNKPLRLVGHEQTVYKAIFSPDSRQLATVSWDMTVRLWDLDTRSELFRLRLPDDWILSNQRPSPLWDFDFRCTPTGCWIAVPLTSGKLALYNLGNINYD